MSASGETPYRPGRVLLGKYELVQPLAEGGMGVVWVARHRALDVDVAVKLTTGDASEESRARQQRALSEARLAAQLAHPAICRVLDFGLTAEGDPCVVTELLRGETLDRVLLIEGKLSAVTAVQIIVPVLDALAAAHEHGIVHQDVKPSNIFLSRDVQHRLQPKLLDFGIARAHNERASWEQAGTVSGTPCYMSPEQASGTGDIDARSDLWSVCATLYELLSGVPPFDGQTCASLLSRVIRSEPKPLEQQALEDPELSAIVLRGLEKQRERRWSSATELSVALARWLLARGVEVDVSGQALRARVPGVEQPTAAFATGGTLVSRSPAYGTPRPRARPWWQALPQRAKLLGGARSAPRAAVLAFGALLALTTSVSMLKARSSSTVAASGELAASSELAASRELAADGPRLPRSPVRDTARAGVAGAPSAPSDVARAPAELADAQAGSVSSGRAAPEPGPLPRNRVAPTPALERSPSVSVAPALPPPVPRAMGPSPRTPPRARENELGYDFGF